MQDLWCHWKELTHARKNDAEGYPINKFREETECNVEKILQQGNEMSENAKARGNALMDHSKFKDWMEPHENVVLLVDGKDTSESDSWLLTYLCAYAYRNEKPIGDPIVLGHFCSTDRSSTNSGSGPWTPKGIMLTLLGQLLDQMVAKDIPISDLFTRLAYAEHVNQQTVLNFAEHFYEFLRALPVDTHLYCFIDGFPWKGPEAHSLLTALTEVRKWCGAVHFKLLLTTREPINREKWRKQHEGLLWEKYFLSRTLNFLEAVGATDPSRKS